MPAAPEFPSPARRRFGIALGSNLGDRAANLRRGIALLRDRVPGLGITGCGGVYETEPVACAPGTQAFLNTVMEATAPCTAEELHAHLKAVEQALGRPEQRERNSPRTLDLDMLYADDVVSDDPVLILPHPRLHLRRFVLQPLADIRPDLRLPGLDADIATLLQRLPDDPGDVRRVKGLYLLSTKH
ncbi:MAG: 2-amino-4-hydroxy-6-hydroxymethyldihydropteridine diphosphokinase [Prosthecobacter sp.]